MGRGYEAARLSRNYPKGLQLLWVVDFLRNHGAVSLCVNQRGWGCISQSEQINAGRSTLETESSNETTDSGASHSRMFDATCLVVSLTVQNADSDHRNMSIGGKFINGDLRVARFLQLPHSSDSQWVGWNGQRKSLSNNRTIECLCVRVVFDIRPLLEYKIRDPQGVELVILFREPIIQEFRNRFGVWLFCEETGRFLYATKNKIVFLSQLTLTRFTRRWKRKRAVKQRILAQLVPACLFRATWSFLS